MRVFTIGFTQKSAEVFFGALRASGTGRVVDVRLKNDSQIAGFSKRGLAWQSYERKFVALMKSRRIEKVVARDVIANACLLCSEPSPDHCHRRLVAEYLRDRWGDVDIVHLG